jgi:hypothetical protein
MEQTAKCKKHLKTLNTYCREVMCYKYIDGHKEKGCRDIVHLLLYMEKEVLPYYKAEIKNLKENACTIEDSTKNFLLSTGIIIRSLLELKEELKIMLKAINNSLELFGVSESTEEINSKDIESSLESKYEELKEAADNENISSLKSLFKPGIGDSEKYLIQAIETSIAKIVNKEELNTLSALLKELNSKYEAYNDSHEIEAKSKFVYGICEPQNDCRVLCKYDISKKKLITTLTVP